MHLSAGVEVWKVDLCTKAKAGDELVSIVIQDNIAYLVNGLLILTLLDRSDIVQGVGLVLDAVAGSEVDADNHGHLHATGQVIGEIVLDGLLEVLENDDSLLCLILHEGEPEIATSQIVKISPRLSDERMPGITEVPEDDRLLGVIIAQPLLVYLDRRKLIILAVLYLTLV